MKRAMLWLAVFGLAGSLWAADAFVGTWIFDIAKSKVTSRGTAPKDAILVIADKGTDRESYWKETNADGSIALTKWTVPQQGGIVKYQQPRNDRSDTSIVTRINGGEDFWTILEKGKQFEFGHWTVSKDGKTIRGVVKGVDAKGKPYEDLWIGGKR